MGNRRSNRSKGYTPTQKDWVRHQDNTPQHMVDTRPSSKATGKRKEGKGVCGKARNHKRERKRFTLPNEYEVHEMLIAYTTLNCGHVPHPPEDRSVLKQRRPTKRAPATVAALADAYGVSSCYFRKKSTAVRERRSLARKPRLRTGVKWDEAMEEVFWAWAKDELYDFTYDDVGRCPELKAAGVRRTTACNFVQQRGKQRYCIVKPSLKEHQWAERWEFAEARANADFEGWVHLDEKMFYARLLRHRRLKLPMWLATPYRHLQSKTQIPSLHVLAALARPDAGRQFDGKICCEQVARPYTAKKASKNHAKGEVYLKPANMDAALFLDLCTKHMIPAIKQKMAHLPLVLVQMDGARAHTGKGNVEKLNAAGALGPAPKVEFVQQPAQSPDLNIMDLCIFASWASRNHKLQKFCSASDTKDLWSNVEETFWQDLDVETINKSWQDFKYICREVVRLKGGNHWTPPHMSPAVRQQLLPDL